MVLGKVDSQKNETGSSFYTLTKVNSKWIKDLNLRPETVKLLEESIVGKLLDIDLANNLLNLTSKSNKSKNKQVGQYQIKISAQQRKPSTK